MVESILQEFPAIARPTAIVPLGNSGGFSGAQLWKVTASERLWCLRRWPKTHPSPEQLTWIHRNLVHAFEQGCDFLPVPMQSKQQSTWVRQMGHLWEITPWMPGEADLPEHCTEEKVTAAFRALAQFHAAFAEGHAGAGADGGTRRSVGRSKGIEDRYRLARQFDDAGRKQGFRPAQPVGVPSEIQQAAEKLLNLALPRLAEIPKQLESLRDQPLALQPCIRDIWHQHVLYVDQRLTGVIDFGAMRLDVVAMDVSRLLGSLLIFEMPNIREVSLAAYQEVAPLTAQEIRMVDVLMRVSPVLSALHWYSWLLIDGREFEDWPHVLGRIREIQCTLLLNI